ncbi:MAG: aminoglycoside 6-adenylyltransferase [Butyrivibrio sp.]|uniref:aminoglycoside 6-adenylyltransferase n=1 Tax=Butyrivibrio sp. TaxID=28121 RepID=UPI0025D53122|nr:aminoglycoside 6-adenylyltransferase [Butyrivibrio sp.]MCR5771920.1 aminoglycoside 6-adenylyltransferase [Butyrivibrio sp.]
MRNEKEMMDLIMYTAREDDRVRAVYMNGSRTNPNSPKDIFQDYDIVYVVKETASFIKDKEWIKRFGDILFMQYPDESPDYPSDVDKSYAWLMVFTDGNRLDLTVKEISHAKENVVEDSLCIILLDKDGILPPIPESSEESYLVKIPSQAQFEATCNEFWWCLNNIAKGLWREEVTYAQDMLNFVVRKQLEKLLSWKIGLMTDFNVSVGKSGKYMHKWLSKEEWDTYLKTFCCADVDSMWDSVDIMCKLFVDTAKYVAEKGGYVFNQEEADNCLLFLKKVRTLSADADSVL